MPLTATAGRAHVLSASTYSKSVLRAVAGELYEDHAEIDYFPSYEIVTSTKAAGSFFEDNLRSETEVGVARVMRTFIMAHGRDAGPDPMAEAEAEEARKRERKAARRAARQGERV